MPVTIFVRWRWRCAPSLFHQCMNVLMRASEWVIGLVMRFHAMCAFEQLNLQPRDILSELTRCHFYLCIACFFYLYSILSVKFAFPIGFPVPVMLWHIWLLYGAHFESRNFQSHHFSAAATMYCSYYRYALMCDWQSGRKMPWHALNVYSGCHSMYIYLLFSLVSVCSSLVADTNCAVQCHRFFFHFNSLIPFYAQTHPIAYYFEWSMNHTSLRKYHVLLKAFSFAAKINDSF